MYSGMLKSERPKSENAEIGKTLKSELLRVRISAHSDLRRLGLKCYTKSVQNQNIWYSAIWAQTQQFWAQLSQIRTI